ncbi:hypothetical protein [Nitrospirillum amazonense]|uniref:hypothetical protein n=1 Tax=Nitrospirillum amazonense TaxID=28077 RepID=UPI0024123B32|nr:hypothetical protein [Nitrospirillum amazonense]MDG3443716.1 hypothetical protein [Nitrospirillum amazonense]
MPIYVAQGVNPVVPGLIMMVCETKELAEKEANSILDAMLPSLVLDGEFPHPLRTYLRYGQDGQVVGLVEGVTDIVRSHVLEAVRELGHYSADDLDVWIVETQLIRSAPRYLLDLTREDEVRHIIRGALEVATERYREDAKTAASMPNHQRLADQFLRQAAASSQLLEVID